MALTLIFSRGAQLGRVGDLVIDATISERHERKNRVTQWPVEDGTTISDHIANEPRMITMQCFITDSPVKSGSQTQPRVQNAYNDLEDMWKKRELIDIYTKHRVYRSMGITRISVERDKATGRTLRFTVEAVEVVKVRSETVEIPADSLPPRGDTNSPADTTADQATSGQDAGRQPADTVPPPAGDTQPGSILHDIIYGGGE